MISVLSAWHRGSLLLLPFWGCVSTPCLSLALPLPWLLIPWGLIDGSRWLSIGVGVQVWLLEADIDGQDWCPGCMEWQLGSLGLRGNWGSPLPCQDLGVGVLKAADPAARMGVQDGTEGR